MVNDFESAIVYFLQAIQLKPDDAGLHNAIGYAFFKMGRMDDSLRSFQRAIAISPDCAEAYFNCGNLHYAMRRVEDAIAMFDKSLHIKPDDQSVVFNKSLALLLSGDLRQGMQMYEARWREKNQRKVIREFKKPQWTGDQSLNGKTILLHHEQGMGDTIQFSRYARILAQSGASIILMVQDPLVGLFKNLGDDIEVIGDGLVLPEFDYHCPLLSLPNAFRTDLHSIPLNNAYLSSDSEKIDYWKSRLGKKSELRIGLVWSGNSTHHNDRNRSISLKTLLPFLPDGIQYVSLQKELPQQDKSAMQSTSKIIHFGEELREWSQTAALCSCMDLVISVDTAVAHLSGALGKDCWVLIPYIPDWRWMLDRSDTPWYSSLLLFRQQEAGKWYSVLDEIKARLIELRSSFDINLC